MRGLFPALISTGALAGAMAGCLAARQTPPEADEIAACADVCDVVERCVEPDLVLSTCVQRCEARAEEDSAFEGRLQLCSICIEPLPCSRVDLSCAQECEGILPDTTFFFR